MLQLSLYNENHEFVQLNELKTRFLKDSYCERPCINGFKMIIDTTIYLTEFDTVVTYDVGLVLYAFNRKYISFMILS